MQRPLSSGHAVLRRAQEDGPHRHPPPPGSAQGKLETKASPLWPPGTSTQMQMKQLPGPDTAFRSFLGRLDPEATQIFRDSSSAIKGYGTAGVSAQPGCTKDTAVAGCTWVHCSVRTTHHTPWAPGCSVSQGGVCPPLGCSWPPAQAGTDRLPFRWKSALAFNGVK